VLLLVRVEGVSWVTWLNKRPSMSPREIVIRCINTNNIGPGIVVFFVREDR